LDASTVSQSNLQLLKFHSLIRDLFVEIGALKKRLLFQRNEVCMHEVTISGNLCNFEVTLREYEGDSDSDCIYMEKDGNVINLNWLHWRSA
jgi:hypothetical protein